MLWQFVAGIAVVFGGAIFVHEFGHFLVAKFFDVKIHVFSLGFGKRLFGWKTSETDYRVSLLPLGGYVKMEGEAPGEKITEPERSFSSKPRWQKICICFAGPLANVILAVFTLTGVYMIRFEEEVYLSEVPRIAYIEPESPAAISGLHKGDVIVAVNDRAVRTWREVMPNVAMGAGKELLLEIWRSNSGTTRLNLDLRKIDPGNPDDLYRIGFFPAEPVIVAEFQKHSSAREAGMKVGDKIVAANGVEILAMSEFISILNKSNGRHLDLVVERNSAVQKIAVAPFFNKDEKRWLISFFASPPRVTVKKLAVTEAITASIEQNKEVVVMTVRSVAGMVRGKVSAKGVSGPIGIGSYAGRAAQLGILPLLQFLALISISLGILNLLPILPLDGGHIFVFSVESLIKRDLSDRFKQGIAFVGYGIVLFLFALGLWNDVGRLLGS